MRPLRLLHALGRRPRLLLAIALGVAVAIFVPPLLPMRDVTRALVAWNAGTLLYIALAAAMMATTNPTTATSTTSPRSSTPRRRPRT